ncbi:MAG: TonB-dependent receptor [Sphingobacterium sp.]|nr:hypothetical protein FM107_16280 [Sphingobacterium sp. JB170]
MKIFIVFFFLAMSLGCTYGQTYELLINVIDTNNVPVSGANVEVSGVPSYFLTDSMGSIRLTELSSKSYEIVIQREGYEQSIRKVSIPGDNVITVVLPFKSRWLKEVIVMNDHLRTSRQEEPLNMDVVNRDFIRRNLGGSLMSTLSRLPGIKTIGIGSGQSKPLIRGLGFNRVVVVDKGVKHQGQEWGADHGLEIDQFAAGEVELIKGAASFLYGSDAIGGVINVKPPTVPEINTLGGSIDILGKTNNTQYGSSVNLYGRKERMFFDGRLTYQSYGDYRVPTDTVYVYDYAVPLDRNHLRNTAGRETDIHFNTGYLSDHFRSLIYFSNVHSHSGFFANAHGLEPRRVDAKMHDRSARDILMPSQKVNHFKVINKTGYETGGHSIEMELGFQRNFRQEYSPYVSHGYMPALYPDSMTIPENLERQFDKRVYSVNLRDQIAVDRHSLTLGINSEYQNNTISGWTFLVPAFKQTSAGIFVYDKFKLNERILMHGALRYDYGRMAMSEYVDWFPSELSDGATTSSKHAVRADNLKRTFHSMVWSLGLNYNRGNFSLKSNIGKSFRMPIAKELGANGVNYHYFSYERGDPSLSPEQSYQLDLGLAWTIEKLSVQLSPFYNYFPNYIYLNPTAQHDTNYGAGNQIFQYAQSRVVRYGGELNVKFSPLKTLNAELLGEYLYAEQLSGDKKGYTLPFSPPTSVLFNLTWMPNTGERVTNSYVSVDYRITGKQDNIVPPEKKTPGYQIFNIQAGTKLNFYGQPISVSIQGQNLFNTRYMNHTSFYRLIELPEMGRNIVLSIKVPFKITNQK